MNFLTHEVLIFFMLVSLFQKIHSKREYNIDLNIVIKGFQCFPAEYMFKIPLTYHFSSFLVFLVVT